MSDFLGFKCGIEIHQRLDCQRKLFCHCKAKPAELSAKPSGMLSRKLKAVVGELGQTDQAALFEQGREREFEYLLFEGHDCLVEADEMPPFEIDNEALETALSVALMLNAKPLDFVVVMRKTVVDGSAVGGFQRTALVAVDGFVETSKGKVVIPTICVEEDSAGNVETSENKATYRLDRLGVPLIELATDASIKDGLHCREVAEKIGMLLRSTGKVQRGLGTIRQDLNVSIAKGARVEIKGAQELEDIEGLVENEALRQQKLVEIKEELAIRGASAKAMGEKIIDATHLFKSTNSSIIAKALQAQGKILAVKLPGFAKILGMELMPSHRFGTELSGYAKAAAGVGGIIHSDEDLPKKYSFTPQETMSLEKELELKKGDAWILVASDEKNAYTAISAAVSRAKAAFEEVPKETRRAQGTATTYMRPLPGGSRMYPETDLPVMKITAQQIEEIKDNLPLTFDERKAKYLKLGLNEEFASRMVKSPSFPLFEYLLLSGAPASFVAATVLETFTSLRRQGVDCEAIEKENLRELLGLFASEKIVKAAVPEALVEMSKTGKSALAAVKSKGLEKLLQKEVDKLAEELYKKKVAPQCLLGEIMKSHRLNVDPAQIEQAVLRFK